MDIPLDRLCTLLKPFQNGEVEHIPVMYGTDPGWTHRRFLEHEHPQVKEIEGLACEYLIGGSGPNYPTIRHVERLTGVKIGPGEQDSFGWLTGAIFTQAGVIIYG